MIYQRRTVFSARAFSLVELLVAIVVVFVLAALALQMFGSARRAALQVRNIGNLRQIGAALLTYANDFNGDIPPSRQDDIYGMPQTQTWGNALTGPPRYLYTGKWGASFKGRQDYLDSPDVFYSPFVSKQSSRKRGEFYRENGGGAYLGYILYWAPVEGSFGGAMCNTNIRRATRGAPIYSDYCSEIGVNWLYTGTQCSVLYVDGSVRTFALEKVNTLKWVHERVSLFMTP
ncbi:MAG TPA: type II secretion system protein [Chthoniobacteraceae bacterium]|nr:type II secretion system protein [Chthoniobacteraceae bacterium]